jgi:very-short-patch-repair endonuclease
LEIPPAAAIRHGFILDFYCAETNVALELDGPYHLEEDQKEYDENRTQYLAEFGIRARFGDSVAIR